MSSPRLHDDADMLNSAELAALLGIAPGTLRQWRHRGKGPAWFRYSGAGPVRYRVAAVREWIAAAEARNGQPTDSRSVSARVEGPAEDADADYSSVKLADGGTGNPPRPRDSPLGTARTASEGADASSARRAGWDQ